MRTYRKDGFQHTLQKLSYWNILTMSDTSAHCSRLPNSGLFRHSAAYAIAEVSDLVVGIEMFPVLHHPGYLLGNSKHIGQVFEVRVLRESTAALFMY